MPLNNSQALNTAKSLVLQRKIDAAIGEYRKIIEADPADLATINTLGDLYVGVNRVQEAIAQFSIVADGYLKSGVPRKAIAVLAKILALDASNIGVATKLAELYAEAGLPAEARRYYLQIAEAYRGKGQMADALGVYRNIVDLDPSNASTRIKLGELYLREGMSEPAYEAFITAADQLARRGELRRARNVYNEALAIRPNTPEAFAAANKLARMLGDAPLQAPPANEVVGDAEPVRVPRALHEAAPREPAPKNTDSAFVVHEISKAEILVAYGNVNQAISMLQEVLNRVPDNVDIHNKLKDIYLRTGMLAEAARESGELARIHQARGDDERARDYAVRANLITQSLDRPSAALETKTTVAGKPEPRLPDSREAGASDSGPLESERIVTVEPMLQTPPEMREVIPAAKVNLENDLAPSRAPDSLENADQYKSIPEIPEERVRPRPALQRSTPELPAPHSSRPPRSAEVLSTVAPLNLVCMDESLPDDGASSGALSPNQSLSLERIELDSDTRAVVPATLVGPSTIVKKRTRVTAASIAAGVFALLAGAAVIGGFAYDAHLNKQYQALTLAASTSALPSSPPVVAEEPAEPQQGQPISIDVRAPVRADETPRLPEPEPAKVEQPPVVTQPVSVPPKAAAQPMPTPPRTSVASDDRAAGDGGTPAGVPTGIPSAAPSSPEPPPRVVPQSKGVVLGAALKKVEPVYPAAARQALQGGRVAVEVIVNELGNVTSARGLSGPPLLISSAVAAARSWRFKPSTLGGVPVKTTTTIIFNFKLPQ